MWQVWLYKPLWRAGYLILNAWLISILILPPRPFAGTAAAATSMADGEEESTAGAADLDTLYAEMMRASENNHFDLPAQYQQIPEPLRADLRFMAGQLHGLYSGAQFLNDAFDSEADPTKSETVESAKTGAVLFSELA